MKTTILLAILFILLNIAVSYAIQTGVISYQVSSGVLQPASIATLSGLI